MITVLTGDNSFAINQAVKGLVDAFGGAPEKLDGTALESKHLPDLLMGTMLFAQKRLVMITDLSKNKPLWDTMNNWLWRVSSDIHLVLIEEKPDKRTAIYKELKTIADVHEYKKWSEKDWAAADTWVVHHAASMGLTLDKKLAHQLVERVGMDQWQLVHSLEKLTLLETVTEEAIDSAIDANPTENVFQLFELALTGDARRVRGALRTLALTEEPYRLFALLLSQVVQLAVMSAAGPNDNPAKDFGMHPYVASKLTRIAQRLGRPGVKHVVEVFAKTDADMKQSRGEPWLLIEKTLLEIM